MNKDKIKGVVFGAVLALSLTSTPVLAKVATEAINVSYNNIKIYMDGTLVEPKDANGNVIEPFIYNGTTYLPVRAVGEAIGKEVNWDAATSSVYLGEKTATETIETTYLTPYEYMRGNFNNDTYTGEEDGETFTMSGTEYSQGFTIKIAAHNDDEGRIALDGEYDKVTFKMGYVDGEAPDHGDINVKFYLDGTLIDTIDNDFDYAKQVELDVTDGNALTVKVTRADGNSFFTIGFGNVIAE